MVNWAKAIERNRDALLRVVEALFALIGLNETAAVATLPRCTRNHVLRILRPAESAARRLIMIAARGISVTLRSSSGRRGSPSSSVILGPDPRTHSVKPAKSPKTKNTADLSIAGGGHRLHGMGPRLKAEDDARYETSRPTANTMPSLPLLDPLKRFDFTPRRRYAKTFPRISIIGVTEPRPIPEIRPPSPGDPLDATRLCRRLAALKRALDDIDGHAKRLARWKARRDLRRQQPDCGPIRLSPMRPGWPPGYRKRRVHEIDDILRECHSLAVYAQRRDTS